MSSENQSPAPSVQSSLNTSEIASNEQVNKSMLAITRLRDLLAAASIALANVIEQNQPEDTKNQIRLTIAATEGDLAILMPAHTHLLRSGSARTEQVAPQSHVVPRELPVLQWQGNDLNLNVDWHCLLPIVLLREQLSWYDNYLCSSPELSWSFVRDAFIKVYGINNLEHQVQLTHELMLMRMSPTETVSNYTDCYQRVRWEADVADNIQAAIAYTATLLPELARQVSLLQVNMPRKKRDTIDKAASLAQFIYSKVFLMSLHNDPVPKGRHLSPEQTTRMSAATSSARSPGSSHEATQSREHSSSKRCSLHGKGSHDSKDCHILKNALAAKGGNWVEKAPYINKYVGSAPCRWCGEVWSHKLCCSSIAGSFSSSSSASGSLRGSAPHFTIRFAHTVSDNSSPSDVSTSEDDQSMHMNFEQCSPCKYMGTHVDLSKQSTHSYLIPISLEKEKLQALVDTGATISSVNTKLCSKFGWSIIPRKEKIVLATILDLAENKDVSIGTDLMPSLGIHLLGLAESWYGSNTPQTPTPIAEIEKLNNSPAGTPTEHSQFIKALLPFIKANEAIPITSFCTVKESIV
ncbi:hypothetical protein PHYBLDRAFT_169920 [Phycomyces blakesleeanus NRRL 1555(-)]|uniref:Retrotransposon gag domain-containing protein n=1 Tax=Phycomyces blakesleeanus (strain ATCC 8743b / DSM 1359 / FGSC 10004 / NBRC 33097 / NRRL 1555) TaxID=763407 RepID=A0A163A9T1_PHYB8|nr:hypothetical protein PHYBLDRAFT_169920 [Phycomyces blakesleeanus NRRL 1555(-)]OAD72011.1 hypothetical protein PHYBLDRAFT_169920 [Phycomyces blakesleeanus NRRL 1555(-)]|eukprot:XP_018290051.1 hypothetical protein PHYBLDRAFT_169920 [Phycomyces blakesleeanus NRRL 1555(-)]